MLKHLPTLTAAFALTLVLAAPAAMAAGHGDGGKGKDMGKNAHGVSMKEQRQLEAKWGVRCSKMGDQAKINECVADLKAKEKERLKMEKEGHRTGDLQ